MSPFEYKSGSDGVTMVIVSVIRLTPRVSGLCQSGRRVATSALWRGGDPKYSRGGRRGWVGRGGLGGFEQSRGEDMRVHGSPVGIMVPGVMIFLYPALSLSH